MKKEIFSWVNKKIKEMNWVDIKLIKITVAALTLMLAKLWPVILTLPWYVYLVIGVVAAIKPYSKIFKN
jgi:hypothetical protein